VRRIRSLEFASEIEPPGNRKGGTKDFAPSAGAGLKYEADLAAHVRELGLSVKHGQWFKFRDKKGTNYCQTDILALGEKADRLILIEAKLTQTIEGELKLNHLYVPLMRKVYGIPVFPVLAYRNALEPVEHQVKDLREMFSMPRRKEGIIHHYHWSAL